MRIQCFPGPDLEARLKAESASTGVNISVLVIDALNKYYGLVGPNTKPLAQLETEVLDEVAAYVADPANAGTEFDLNAASATYEQIDMTCAGKPKAVKAQIGKKFAKEIGVPGRFEKVALVLRDNGTPKRTVANRAAIYRILA